MKKTASLFFFILFVLFASQANGQTPTPQRQVKPADDDDVVRITTNLIQVDVVVTDKKGKLVTNLKPEDFEILENNKPQKITNFSFITLDAGPGEQPVATKNSLDKTAPPAPSMRLRSEQVRRTIALVVDDLSLSFDSIHFTREALKKFVKEQMQPGDLVAIIRASSGIGALQQFTSDKRQLLAAIERVKFSFIGRGNVSAFAPIDSTFERVANLSGQGQNNSDDEPTRDSIRDLDDFREEIFAVGTLGAVNYVVRGMRELPGRKAVLLMSEGFRLFNRDNTDQNARVMIALRRLTDLANRSSVVIYTMDSRGLQTTGITAADDVRGLSPQQLESRLSDRRNTLFETQQGLQYLAQETGGFAVRNTNDLSGGIRKVLDDQKGYYLVGYQPDSETFDPVRSRFHRLKVKVKGDGLSARYRSGFFGIKDEEAKPVAQTPTQQIRKALYSPFASGDVSLRLTSIFTNEEKAGTYIRSFMHIPAKDLTFTTEPNGWHKTVIDIVIVTFGDNGIPIDQASKTYTLTLKEDFYQQALKNGFVYSLNVPVKKAGAYQLRAVVRDENSERVGSANQFIEVPDLKKNKLSLSGIILNSFDPQAKKTEAAADSSQPTDASTSETDPLTQTALRRFHNGTALQYGCFVYNAKIDKKTNQAQLTTQTRIFRDGKQIFVGKEIPVDTNGQTDLKRLRAEGAIHILGLEPGEYVLQIVVTDALAKEKHRTVTSWIEFEVIK
jgi:VWFA-related protein